MVVFFVGWWVWFCGGEGLYLRWGVEHIVGFDSRPKATIMCEKKRLGYAGEEHVSQYLTRLGFTILERNWRCGHLEVDIVALKSGVTHIVEVKTRSEKVPVAIHELLSYSKRCALLRAANRYALRKEEVLEVQIDLAVVLVGSAGYRIEYYEDAVVPHF